MSNSVYTESFFSNKEVPMCEKLGLIALTGGGTYEKSALSYNGQDKSFMSLVCFVIDNSSSIRITRVFIFAKLYE